jgi:hypothetical protein
MTWNAARRPAATAAMDPPSTPWVAQRSARPECSTGSVRVMRLALQILTSATLTASSSVGLPWRRVRCTRSAFAWKSIRSCRSRVAAVRAKRLELEYEPLLVDHSLAELLGYKFASVPHQRAALDMRHPCLHCAKEAYAQFRHIWPIDHSHRRLDSQITILLVEDEQSGAGIAPNVAGPHARLCATAPQLPIDQRDTNPCHMRPAVGAQGNHRCTVVVLQICHVTKVERHSARLPGALTCYVYWRTHSRREDRSLPHADGTHRRCTEFAPEPAFLTASVHILLAIDSSELLGELSDVAGIWRGITGSRQSRPFVGLDPCP